MLALDFDTFTAVSGKTLLLRQLQQEDAADVYALRSDRELMKYIPRPVMKHREEAAPFIQSLLDGYEKKELINWAITKKDQNILIGIIGFYRMAKEHNRAEVGYILNRNFHRQGILQEALPLVCNFGFSVLKMHTIEAVIDPRNLASEKLLLKNQFIKEAHFCENFLYNEMYLDSVHYVLHAK